MSGTLQGRQRRALEAILFVADQPVGLPALAAALQCDERVVLGTLQAVRHQLVDEGHGFVVRETADGWRMYSDPGVAADVERFIRKDRAVTLSRAALETLAVVAYRQPVTKAEVSAVRGVEADAALRGLVERGLVEQVGRDPAPGQAIRYGTTGLLLDQLGLDDLAELPPLSEMEPGGPLPSEVRPGRERDARRALDTPS